MIRIENLSKSFHRHTSLFCRQKVDVLRGIHLTVERGSLLVIKGPNGAGKTTLLKIIAGLIRPDRGSVWVHGISSLDPQRIHALVGMVTGDARSFYARLSGLENLRIFAATQAIYGKEFSSRVWELAQQLDFLEQLDVRYQELSQGMKARLALIRALVHDPEVLLLDEPLRSIDSEWVEFLKRWIQKTLVQRQKKTVLCVSHRNEEFSGWEGKLLFMREGRIQCEDRIENFQSAPQEEQIPVSP